jgi:hypothetical protein
LSELEIGGVGGEQTSGRGIGGGHADLRVDVEHALGSAGGPYDGGAVGLVVLEIVAVYRANEVVLSGGLVAIRSLFVVMWKGTCLLSHAGEVVSRL